MMATPDDTTADRTEDDTVVIRTPGPDDTVHIPTTDDTVRISTADNTTVHIPTADETVRIPTADDTVRIPTADDTVRLATADETMRFATAGADGNVGAVGEVVELTKTPATGPLYRRAAIALLPGRRRSSGATPPEVPSTLPDTELRLRGVTVDRGHLAAYDRVCGFRLTDTLPATYPHVLAFPLAMRLMTAPGFPFPLLGLVHIANRITLYRPIDASEPLDLSVRTAELRPHRRGRQFEVLATASVGGEPVWRDVSTYLRREAGVPVDERHEPVDRPEPPAATGWWRVTPRVGTAYARVSGDRNPIHTSRLGARLLGYPRPIAHGMWSKARCLAALEGRLPEAYTVEVAFKLPVPLPGTLAFSATPGRDFALHDVDSGRPHLTGTLR